MIVGQNISNESFGIFVFCQLFQAGHENFFVTDELIEQKPTETRTETRVIRRIFAERQFVVLAVVSDRLDSFYLI